MANLDAIELIQAVGKVTIYSAYIEGNIIGLISFIKNHYTIERSEPKPQLSSQVEYLTKLFKNRVHNTIKLSDEDKNDILDILREIKALSKKRNDIIHSTIKEHINGKIVKENPITNISKFIENKDVNALADQLQSLNKEILRIRVHLMYSYH